MKRVLFSLTLMVAVAVTVATEAGAQNPAHAAGAATVQQRHTALGKILVDGAGFTLYVFTRDRRNRDACVSINRCTSVWHPLRTSGRPTAGRGVQASRLSTIRLPQGVMQVTYDGSSLYTYSGDSRPGETDYVGKPQFGGRWYAIDPAGHVVRQHKHAAGY